MNTQTALQCHSTDEGLEQLLEEITGRIQTGELVTAEDYAADYPEYIDRLHRLLPAMQALLAFGRSQSATTDGDTISASTTTSGVLGDFRIIREIGRGGMGVVYETEQISIGRRVALKVLPFASMLDERRLARFHNEVRAAGQLHHSNIVPIYAVGSDRGVHYYAMQLVAGHSLAEIITEMKSGRPPSEMNTVPPAAHLTKPTAGDTARAALSTLRSSSSAAFFDTVAQLAIQAAEALEHAHSCGVVHRDIKPSNLLLDERGCLWLTDFGLASVETGSDLTMTGELLGTLRYMSPEQSLGSRVVLDHRTDIYSLGVTLYELLTLQPAFDDADRGELLRRIAHDEPALPRRLNRNIPEDLETVVLKSMSKEAASRYATAQHLADDLRRFLEDKPIVARRPTLWDRGRKWVTRHAALVSLAAAMLAVIAVCGAGATWLTLNAYKSEAQQRTAAEANLAVASQTIDRMLSRVADEHYYQGDLKQAETLAGDATAFYEKLLMHNDDPALRFRAAEAYGDVAHIWELVDRHEKAGSANRRASELLQRLTTQHPDRPEYVAALASAYNRIGLVDWSLDRPLAAEPSFRQAWEIWTELSERFPQEPKYQDGVADMLSNLGSVCYFSDRFDEAEEYYRRATEITKHLPVELNNSAQGLASQAGSITCQAQLALLREDYDRALKLLHASIPIHEQSLAKWPTNPVALDCYFTTHWSIATAHLGAGRHAEAVTAVERYIEVFPRRLQAYHEGAVHLLQCAELAGRQESQVPAEPAAVSLTGSATASPSHGLKQANSVAAATYRDRARELISQAHNAPQRTPDTMDHFASFLLTCDDESFRDAPHALAMAKSVVKEVPERATAWFTLALAHYRMGDWQAADEAVQKLIKCNPDGQPNAYDSTLMAMIRYQQGHPDEAHKWQAMASKSRLKNSSEDEDFARLATEAEELIEPAQVSNLVQ